MITLNLTKTELGYIAGALTTKLLKLRETEKYDDTEIKFVEQLLEDMLIAQLEQSKK